MFTGIVQGIATVESLDARPGLTTFVIRFPEGSLEGVTTGASVAINGTCLTVTAQQDNQLWFDAMQETLRLTTLGELAEGSQVNFERAARIGDEIGGHLLSGHIHCTARVVSYIAVNGASLTIGDVEANRFNVHLIPETLRATTFSDIHPGDRVNIEVDSQTQTIVDTLARMGYDRPAG